ncbi:unnamed protein product [Thlaspi arvense]|uniref:Uncharacterized protein n=1 Tax=Thlaspi arvense TaxID=13288 RepID=A0AAU9RAR1_THLAR|nr:unnamed protein product [Thlaspi arvense]
MTDPEKLTALKKAYADTILNTAKEAAARVMISDKKARGYQQELGAVRDEALRTCLRLKQMYDSKVKEAEMISLKKQQKIEELEAQLGEAEDIVGELRMELRESRYLLERLTNVRQMDLCDAGKLHSEPVSLVREESSNHERSVVANVIKPHLSDRDISVKRCFYKENKDPCHHTLPSILSRRREAEALDCNIASGDDVESLTSSKAEARTEEEKENDVELSTTSVSPSEKQCDKFTLKRKRKKGARSSSSSPERGGSSSSQDDESRNRRQKTGEKDNGYLDSFNTESCRDSRRVAQVARQLLPFSEKRVLQQSQSDEVP